MASQSVNTSAAKKHSRNNGVITFAHHNASRGDFLGGAAKTITRHCTFTSQIIIQRYTARLKGFTRMLHGCVSL